jgi:branched-chain amino acid transport system ATP-binding protein
MLVVEGLQAGYGAIEVLRGISLEVKAGEIVTLIGANGAGKTTTLMSLCGVVKARAGSIRFLGEELIGVPSHEIVKKGLVQSPEGRKIFPRLTVAENLEMGAFTRTDGAAAVAKDRSRVLERFPILAERQHQAGGTLSGGEQQMLAVGRAMMTRPKLLLLDEPSLGLAPLIVKRIFEVVAELAAEGTTVLLVEQNARMALKLAHRGYVMETGRLTMSGPSAELLADPRVQSAYLGEGEH